MSRIKVALASFLTFIFGCGLGGSFASKMEQRVISVTYTAPLYVSPAKATVIVTREVNHEVVVTQVVTSVVEVPITVEVEKRVVVNKFVEVPVAPKVIEITSVPQVSNEVVVVASGSYPCADGQIKGNRNSGIYHVPSGNSYANTTDNVACFNNEDEAVNAGFRKAKK